MTAEEFRTLALALPEAQESAHQGHPDFRVRNRIFATLTGDEERGMVKLSPDQQADALRKHPGLVEPASGAWGRSGATLLSLSRSSPAVARALLIAAWRNTAPKRLVESIGAP